MPILTRRLFLQGAGAFVLATGATGGYASGIEAALRLDVTSYRLVPPHWPDGLTLKAAILADIHACEPWMPAERVRLIAEVANSLYPDIIFLLGDFNGSHKFVTGAVMPDQWAESLSILKAPLGAYAILGNHDWWHGPLPNMRGDDCESIRRVLAHAGIKLLENEAISLNKGGHPFWVAGLADQWAWPRAQHIGADDLPGTLAKVKDDAPIVLLAHEPYIFKHVPDRVSLTLCGHTHGGQINVPVLTPSLLASRRITDYIYGHIVEEGRHMIISGGLGTSVAPFRFNRPPEVVELTLGANNPALASQS